MRSVNNIFSIQHSGRRRHTPPAFGVDDMMKTYVSSQHTLSGLQVKSTDEQIASDAAGQAKAEREGPSEYVGRTMSQKSKNEIETHGTYRW